jgi:hypothetical protein
MDFACQAGRAPERDRHLKFAMGENGIHFSRILFAVSLLPIGPKQAKSRALESIIYEMLLLQLLFF